jgi:putative flippase GtrA
MSAPPTAQRRSGRAALVQYLLIGVLTVGVDVGLLVLLRDVLTLPISLAAALAFGTSVVVNFALNRLLHAGASPGELAGHLVRYGLLLSANLLLTVLVLTAAERAGLPYLPVKLGIVASMTCWNFVLYRRWVFAPRTPQTAVGAD